MKTKFTKKEKERLKFLQAEYEQLEGAIKGYEVIIYTLIKSRNAVFNEFCRITNPDPSGEEMIRIINGKKVEIAETYKNMEEAIKAIMND